MEYNKDNIAIARLISVAAGCRESLRHYRSTVKMWCR